MLLVYSLANKQANSENKKFLLKHVSKKFICTNPDLIVHRGRIEELCAGSVAKVFEDLGGKVIYFGKPHEEVYNMCIGPNEKVLAIGDNLRTDIKGANLIGLDSILVLGGLFSNNSKDKILESIENKGIYPNFFIDEFNW